MSKPPGTKPARTATRAAIVGITAIAIMASASTARASEPRASQSFASQPWKTYSNVLYGYTGCYPPALFTGHGESDNSSGQTFTAPGGATIWMYGSYRAELSNPTLANSLKEDEASEFDTTGKPVLQRLKQNYFVFSGSKNTSIIYEKTILSHGTFATLLVIYPKAQSKTYNPLMGALAQCFNFLPPASP